VTTATLTLRRPPVLGQRLMGISLLVIGAIVIAGATLAGNGNPVVAVAPIALLVCAYVVCILPVRYTVFSLIFLSLALDVSEEGPWSSPLAPLGMLLAHNLNKTIPISALVIPGIGLAMLALIALLWHRSFTGSEIDSRGRTPAPAALYGGLATSFISIFVLVALGKMRGGDMQMAKVQVQNFVLMLTMAYLVAMSFRSVQDYRVYAKIIVVAAVSRAFYVMYVIHHLKSVNPGAEIPVAATHGDSLLFAAAVVLLIVRFMEKPSRRAMAWCVTLIPIMLIGMQLNNRRLVWVQVAAGLLTFALLSRRSQMKRLAAHGVLLMLPLIVAYIAIGWNSSSKIFAPIKTYRSVTDGKVDPSTLYRDLENFNLLQTMRVHPLTGQGFGQPFVETVVLPDISRIFREYKYFPHNAVLGLWAFTGPLGFSGLMMAIVVAMFFAIRSYRMATSNDERTAAVLVIAMFVIYFAHCWGDMGFSERRQIFLVGPALAIAGQLAYATGAYRARTQNARLAR